MNRLARNSFALLLLCFCQQTQQQEQVVVPPALRAKFGTTGLEWEDFIEELTMQLIGDPSGGNSEPWEAPEPGEEPEPTLEPNFLDPNSTLYKILMNDSIGVSLEELASIEELPPLPVTQAPGTQEPLTLSLLNDTLTSLSSIEGNFTSDNTTETTDSISLSSIISSILASLNDTLVPAVDSTTSRPSNRIYGTTPSPRGNINPLGRTRVDVKPSLQGSLTFHFTRTLNNSVISGNSTANSGPLGRPDGAQIQATQSTGNTFQSTGNTITPTPTPTAGQSQIAGTQGPGRLPRPRTTSAPVAEIIPPATFGPELLFIDASLVGSKSRGSTPAPQGTVSNISKTIQAKQAGNTIANVRANPTPVKPVSSEANNTISKPLSIQGKILTNTTQKADTTRKSLLRTVGQTTVKTIQEATMTTSSPLSIQETATSKPTQEKTITTSSPLSIQIQTTVKPTQKVMTSTSSQLSIQENATAKPTRKATIATSSPLSIQTKTTIKPTRAAGIDENTTVEPTQKASTATSSPFSARRNPTQNTTQKTTFSPLLRQAINSNNPLAWWASRNNQAVDNARSLIPTRPTHSGASPRVSQNRPPSPWQSVFRNSISRANPDTRTWFSSWRSQGAGNQGPTPNSPPIATSGIQTPSGVSTLQSQVRGPTRTPEVRSNPLTPWTSRIISRPSPIPNNNFNIRRRTGTISNVVYAGPDRTLQLARDRLTQSNARSHGSISINGQAPQAVRISTTRSTTTAAAAKPAATTTTGHDAATLAPRTAETAVDGGGSALSPADNIISKSTTAVPARLSSPSATTSAPSSPSNITRTPANDPTPASDGSRTSLDSKTTQSSEILAPVTAAFLTGAASAVTQDPVTTPLPLAELPAALRHTMEDTGSKSAAPGQGGYLHCGILLLSLVLLLCR